MVLYAIMTEQSIGALFAAGVVPGIMATLFYMAAAAIVTARNPALGPPGERSSWAERLAALKAIWGVVVLFGGNVPSSTPYSNDLWSWDGENWQQHTNTTGVPGGRSDTQMVYDPTRRKLMIHSGGTNGFAYEDLWEVQLPVFSRFREYGTACVGSRGPLELRVSGNSMPILGQSFTTRLTGLSSGFAAGVGFVGFSDQSINGIPLPIDLAPVGIPGCIAYHSADIDMPIGLPTGNPLSTTWNLSIPNDTVFLSVEIYLQALALEGFGFSRFATLSNGIAARIGDR
jgi:hypothetical protein